MGESNAEGIGERRRESGVITVASPILRPRGQKMTSEANFIHPNRDTTAWRAARTIEKIATARPPVTGTERGVSNREGDTNISAARLSAWNRFLLHCHPVSGTTSGQQHRN